MAESSTQEKKPKKKSSGNPNPVGNAGHTLCTEKEVIDAVVRWRGKLYMAAHDLKISYMTLKKYMVRWPKVLEVYKECKGKLGDIAEAKLLQLVEDGNLGAICFYLKTQHKDRGYVERIEETGPNGAPKQDTQGLAAPVNLKEIVGNLSVEMKREFLAAIRKAKENQIQSLPDASADDNK